MSTTMVPLLVTGAAELLDGADAEPVAGALAPTELEPAELEPAELDPALAAEVAVFCALVLLLLQAVTPTSNDAARQPAVQLRVRICSLSPIDRGLSRSDGAIGS